MRAGTPARHRQHGTADVVVHHETVETVTLAIDSEPALARLALDLGAERIGGPLAPAERSLVSRAMSHDASDPGVRALAEAQLLRGGDPLGDALTALRTPPRRRGLGQFWTPPAIVAPMLAWALAAEPTRLVDPGCGSGRFSTAAIRLDPALDILAIDLDPLACLMTRAALSVLQATSARVICGDYLTLVIPAHEGRTAWVGNPPYVRHHDLTRETKAWAGQAARSIGRQISGLAGLHALFFLATLVHGSAGDVGTFVTSAEWLDVGYGSIVRRLFTDGMGGRALDLVDPRAAPFEDAMTTALITSFEIGRAPSTVAVRLLDRPTELSRLATGRPVAAHELARARRWSPIVRAGSPQNHEGRALGDIVRVHRGFVTGANRFFLMTRAEADRRGLSAFVTPAITSASEILGADGVIRDAPDRRVVLDLPPDFDRAAHPSVDAYLAEGERLGVDRRYISSHRKPWYRVGPLKPAPIVASYMARQAPRFARNPDGLALLNIGHGLFPRHEMTDHQLDVLTATLNAGREGFVGTGRTYHGGLEKFEPREMEALLLDA